MVHKIFTRDQELQLNLQSNIQKLYSRDLNRFKMSKIKLKQILELKINGLKMTDIQISLLRLLECQEQRQVLKSVWP